jgi:ferric-dicitrate binding protein FerR (iron transport regulator)
MIDDEEIAARLLRVAEPRPAVPADRAARVEQAVTRAWHARIRRQLRRQRALGTAAVLLAAAAIVLAVRLRTANDPSVSPSVRGVALVELVEGTVERLSGDRARASRSPLTHGDSIARGDWLETAATARAALRLAGGVSVRVDSGARTRLVSDRVIELALGALYIDTGASAPALEVRTPFGVAHDIGTQFEVRLERASLRLRVRTGLVELRRDQQTIAVRPGTELVVAAGDAVTREAAPFGPDWEWVTRLAPDFDIEGQALASYLDHVCREQGWTLRYEDGSLAREASGIVLNGSVRGLPAADAVAVAIRISGLAHRLQDGELVIMRSAGQKQ